MLISRSEWIGEVDRALRELYFINTMDAGWDDEDVARYFAYGMQPKEFALWYGEKYDLVGEYNS